MMPMQAVISREPGADDVRPAYSARAPQEYENVGTGVREGIGPRPPPQPALTCSPQRAPAAPGG